MSRPPTDREALIAALAEEARSGAGAEGRRPEPEPEELLDFLAGSLDPEEEERLSRLLAASPEASRALLDLADFEAAGAAAGQGPSDLAAHAGWRYLKERLPDARPWFRRLPPLLSTIAAALLVSTVGLGFRVLTLQEELNRPVVNPQTLTLAVTRADTEPTAPSGQVRLVLRPAERCPAYTAELEGPAARDRQTIPGLERDDGGVVSLLVRLDPGSYGLRLYGCEPRRELEEHRFQITRGHGD
jgi:hypothetical protein